MISPTSKISVEPPTSCATMVPYKTKDALAGTAGLFGNVSNWKGICLFAAVCSAGATVTAKMQTAEQLTEASECVVKLKALRVETIAPTYNLEHVSTTYQQILSEFSTIDC
jgi:hypothetical protein